MMDIEIDVTAGGRPVVRVAADSCRDGERKVYLSICVRGSTAAGKTIQLTDAFIGMSKDELASLRSALERVDETFDAEGAVLEGLW